MPLKVDILIIHKKADINIEKNLGRILRKYNLWEYKSPSDYLSIDDYYKVLGYAYLYKSSADNANAIAIDDLTISYVCFNLPPKLFSYLEDKGYELDDVEPGIYYGKKAPIPTQIIVTQLLSEEKNLLLKALSRSLDKDTVLQVMEHINSASNDRELSEYLVLISEANIERFKEAFNMSTVTLSPEAREILLNTTLGKMLQQEVEQKGLQKGKLEEQELRIKKMLQKGFSYEIIAKIYGITADEIKEIEKT